MAMGAAQGNGEGTGVSRRRVLVTGGVVAGVAWVAPQIISVSAASAATLLPGDVVAVGSAGTIVVSADAITWDVVASPTSVDLEDVAWGSGFGLYAAVGASGTVLISADGRNWEVRPSGTTKTLRAIVYVPFVNAFVAVGSTGVVVISTDGVNFSVAADDVTTDDLLGLATSGSRIIAVGTNGAQISSTTGTSWTLEPSIGADALEDVEHSTGAATPQFLAVGATGAAWTSTDDGASWIPQVTGTSVPYQFASWLPLASEFVVVADDSAEAAHFDGTTWTTFIGFPPRLFAVTYSFLLGLVVVVGFAGIIATSADARNWTIETSNTTEWLRGVAART